MENLTVWVFTNQYGSHYAGGDESQAEAYRDLLNEKIDKTYKGLQVDVDRLKYAVMPTDLLIKDFTNLSGVIRQHIWYNS